MERGGWGEQGRQAPSLHRKLLIKKTLELPRTCCLNQEVKATNFASYKVAVVADCSVECSFLPPRLCGDSGV